MISIIVAVDEKRGIGKNNDLLVKIPADLKRFKEITSGHPIVMGRKTFESIGRVLPNRTNIIITRDPEYKEDGAVVVHSLDEAIEQAKSASGSSEIFIIGGGQIFEQALPMTDRIYLTLVKGDYEADIFFPDYSEFKKVIHQEEGESDGLKYTYLNLERN
jgi:dihydrofolate reductase